LFVASIALATAGILTCSVALLSVVMPNGSPAAYVVTSILFGVLVGGALTAFTWACDQCEGHFPEQQDPNALTNEPRQSAGTATSAPTLDRDRSADLPQPTRLRDEYPKTARGSDPLGDRTHAIFGARQWRGQ
jgi:hypothetical protein